MVKNTNAEEHALASIMAVELVLDIEISADYTGARMPAVRHTISLLIPTKNEAEGIGGFIDQVRPFVDELLVVDGHSTDATAEICQSRGIPVILDNGKGKGAAIRAGLRHVTGDVVVIIDADGSHDPADIPRLVAPILQGEADMVIASRIRGGSDELHGDFTHFLRNMGGGLLTMAINYRWHVRLTDVLNGFRAISRNTALQLDLRANDFDAEQHMVVECLKKGFHIAEIPSHESVRKWGRSKLPTFRKATLFFWRLFLDLCSP